MCECAERLKSSLETAVKNRNDAYKAYQQWEGAVSAMEQLIPILFPLPTADAVVDAEVVKD